MTEGELIEIEHRMERLVDWCEKRKRKLERDNREVPDGLQECAQTREDFNGLVAAVRRRRSWAA